MRCTNMPCILLFIDYLKNLQGNFHRIHFLPCILALEFNCLTYDVLMVAWNAGLMCAWSSGRV